MPIAFPLQVPSVTLTPNFLSLSIAADNLDDLPSLFVIFPPSLNLSPSPEMSLQFCPENQYHKVMPSSYWIGRLSSLLIVLLLLPGCNALNPLCGSARPVPILNSISPTTMVLSQLPPVSYSP
jgi:hypothetical protein